MSSRVVGYTNERLCDRRREILIEAMLDDQPVRILDLGLSGFGADGAKMVSGKVTQDRWGVTEDTSISGFNVLSQSLPQNTKPKPPVKRKNANISAIKPMS